MNWDGIKYFSPAGDPMLGMPSIPGSAENMVREFMLKLDFIRFLFGAPITINSGWRSVEREKQILASKPNLIVPSMQGPNPFTSHTRGRGVDIACTSARVRFFLIKAAITVGINRFGYDDYHLHIDDEPDLPPNVTWRE